MNVVWSPIGFLNELSCPERIVLVLFCRNARRIRKKESILSSTKLFDLENGKTVAGWVAVAVPHLQFPNHLEKLPKRRK